MKTLCEVINEHIKDKQQKPNAIYTYPLMSFSLSNKIFDIINVYCNNYKKNETYADGVVTPLIVACRGNLVDDSLLLSITESPLGIDTTGTSALIYACKNNMEDVALRLIKNNADVNVINKQGHTALLWACGKKMSSVALKLISKCTKNVIEQATNTFGETPLLVACQNQMNDVALEMIKKSDNISYVTNEGQTAFQWAVHNEMTQVIHAMLNHDDNIFLTIPGKNEPILTTVLHKVHRKALDDKIVFYIVNTYYGSDDLTFANQFTIQDNKGYTSLMWACKYYHKGMGVYGDGYIADYILEAMESNHTEYDEDDNPIEDENTDKMTDVIRSSIGLQNNIGETALLILIKGLVVARLGKNKGKLIDSGDNAKKINLAIQLIESGNANIQAKDNMGKSALDYAREKNIMRLLYILEPAGYVIKGIEQQLKGTGQHLDAETVEELVKYTRGGAKNKTKVKKTKKRHKQ